LASQSVSGQAAAIGTETLFGIVTILILFPRMVSLQNILQALRCNGGFGRETAHLLVNVFRKEWWRISTKEMTERKRNQGYLAFCVEKNLWVTYLKF
jgi:hypothetical protein